jgi:hypothetical protein
MPFGEGITLVRFFVTSWQMRGMKCSIDSVVEIDERLFDRSDGRKVLQFFHFILDIFP